jgi:hypothetical protein
MARMTTTSDRQREKEGGGREGWKGGGHHSAAPTIDEGQRRNQVSGIPKRHHLQQKHGTNAQDGTGVVATDAEEDGMPLKLLPEHRVRCTGRCRHQRVGDTNIDVAPASVVPTPPLPHTPQIAHGHHINRSPPEVSTQGHNTRASISDHPPDDACVGGAACPPPPHPQTRRGTHQQRNPKSCGRRQGDGLEGR